MTQQLNVMFNLLLIDETYTNGYKSEFLNIIPGASILSGIFVVISKNPEITKMVTNLLIKTLQKFFMN